MHVGLPQLSDVVIAHCPHPAPPGINMLRFAVSFAYVAAIALPTPIAACSTEDNDQLLTNVGDIKADGSAQPLGLIQL